MSSRCHDTRSHARILGVNFDLIDCHRAFMLIHGWQGAGHRGYVTLTNPHSVMACRRDPRMAEATAGASLVLPDGVGITLAARILGLPHEGRVTGPSLMLAMCDWGRHHGYRHYFYGGAEGVAEELAERLSARYPGLIVAGTSSPPFRSLTPEEDRAVIRRINAARPDILWVGLGAPKQELWMHEHLGRINTPVMIGVGAAFDFHSGRVAWAPGWIRALGLEWAYRLAREPKRLWHRNLDSPLFLLGVLRQRLTSFLRAHPKGPVTEPEAALACDESGRASVQS